MGRGMFANPLPVDEPTRVPASTPGDQASHERPPQDRKGIPKRVRQRLPSRTVQIPISHFIHLQPGRPNRGITITVCALVKGRVRRNT